MLTISQIKHYATEAAAIAEELMGIITRYSISVVDDPTRYEDAMFNTHTNEIIINLAALEPFQPLSSSALTRQASDLDWDGPLEKGRATHSSILAWRIPLSEETGRLQSMGLQRVRHN